MLYKYFPPEREDFLSNRLLRFTQPGDFNDPFELNPRFELLSGDEFAALPAAPGREGPDGRARILTAEVVSGMFTSVLAGLRSEVARHANHEGAFVLDNNRMAQSTFDSLFGILCLSERPDSLLMWAHYADNHRGFVVQFDESHPFFAPVQFGERTLELRKVEYSAERPVLSPTTLSSPHVYYRKSVEWNYEQEWRLVRPLVSASQIEPHEVFPRHLYEIPSEAIRGVILGYSMTHEDRVRMMEIVNRVLVHATLFQTALSGAAYTLEVLPPLDGHPPDAINGRALEGT